MGSAGLWVALAYLMAGAAVTLRHWPLVVMEVEMMRDERGETDVWAGAMRLFLALVLPVVWPIVLAKGGEWP